MALRMAVLGPVRAWRDDVELELGPPQQRALLALLVAHAGLPVPLEEIAGTLWDAQPPASAPNAIRRFVGNLRRVLEPDLPTRAAGQWLLRGAGGYRMEAVAGSTDLLEFRDLVARARLATAEPDSALRLLLEALGRWHGEAATGVDPAVRRHPVFAALERQRLDTIREAVDVALRGGLAMRVLPQVENAAAAYPLDESIQARLVLTRAAAGQRSGALTAYETTRARLADELGIDPGAELRAAYESLSAPAKVSRPTPRPAQLPADLSTFAGRHKELAQALALVRPGSAGAGTVVISAIGGMAGIGKTTLAVHWAHQIAESFPDGQLYVNLRGFEPTGTVLSPDKAIHGFLDALGVPPQQIPASLEARTALYRGLLAERRVLVVLDNARDTEHVRPLLPDSSGCFAIVTSRSELTGLVAAEGARPLALGLLTYDEARDFLARRVGADRIEAEPRAVEEIIAACAGLPLTLAVVAARATTHPQFSLADIAAELRDRPGSLDGFTDGIALLNPPGRPIVRR